MNVCGEGGEYETMTLDCPLFTLGRIEMCVGYVRVLFLSHRISCTVGVHTSVPHSLHRRVLTVHGHQAALRCCCCHAVSSEDGTIVSQSQDVCAPVFHWDIRRFRVVSKSACDTLLAEVRNVGAADTSAGADSATAATCTSAPAAASATTTAVSSTAASVDSTVFTATVEPARFFVASPSPATVVETVPAPAGYTAVVVRRCVEHVVTGAVSAAALTAQTPGVLARVGAAVRSSGLLAVLWPTHVLAVDEEVGTLPVASVEQETALVMALLHGVSSLDNPSLHCADEMLCSRVPMLASVARCSLLVVVSHTHTLSLFFLISSYSYSQVFWLSAARRSATVRLFGCTFAVWATLRR